MEPQVQEKANKKSFKNCTWADTAEMEFNVLFHPLVCGM